MNPLFLATSLFLLLGPAAFADPAPKAGANLQLALPPIWSDDSKTMQLPDAITVNQVGSVDTCSFRGGTVRVVKVANGQVYFDPNPKPATKNCAHLVTTLENFQQWAPAAVSKTKTALEKRQTTFLAQLKEEMTTTTEKGADPCAPQDSELKTGNVYKVAGRIYRYGPFTTALAADGKSCQVELGAQMEINGFDRPNDLAVAIYHQAVPSNGQVPVGVKKTAATCEDGKPVAFSLTKLKSYFQFKTPSRVERIRAVGLIAGLSSQPKVCINDTGTNSGNSSRALKAAPGPSTSDAPISPATSGEATGEKAAD